MNNLNPLYNYITEGQVKKRLINKIMNRSRDHVLNSYVSDDEDKSTDAVHEKGDGWVDTQDVRYEHGCAEHSECVLDRERDPLTERDSLIDLNDLSRLCHKNSLSMSDMNIYNYRQYCISSVHANTIGMTQYIVQKKI